MNRPVRPSTFDGGGANATLADITNIAMRPVTAPTSTSVDGAVASKRFTSASSQMHPTLPHTPAAVAHTTATTQAAATDATPRVAAAANVNTPDATGAVATANATDEQRTTTIMSVVYHRGRLGVAYVSLDERVLHVSEQVETDDLMALRKLKMEIEPTTIVSEATTNEVFVQTLSSNDGIDDTPEVEVSLLKRAEFDAERGKYTLLQSRFMGLQNFSTTNTTAFGIDSNGGGNADTSHMLQLLSSVVDMNQETMLKACAGLLHYLQRFPEFKSNDSGAAFVFADIKNMYMHEVLQIDLDSLKALQIFWKERKSGPKENLSLFSIMNRTVTSHGSKMLRLWFSRPPLNVPVINERLDTIECMLRTDNLDLFQSLIRHLKTTSNLLPVVTKIIDSNLDINGWMVIIKTVLSALSIKKLLLRSSVVLPIFSRFADIVHDEVAMLAELVNKVIDFDESLSNGGRVTIKYGVSAELDNIKRVYANLSDDLDRIVASQLDHLTQLYPWIRELTVVYYPQLGCQIVTPFTDALSQNPMDELEYQFHNENYVYYKNAEMRRLDDELGDICNDIVDMESVIEKQLLDEVANYAPALMQITQVCSELDCLLSLVTCARDMELTRPNVTIEKELYISNGKHPIYQMFANVFVPNSTDMARNGTTMELISGPNFSGKSVYIKQVGMIVFMAHIGSFVPAQGATIGLTDRIYTRLHSRESISLSMSTFGIDCTQVAKMLKTSTSRSLLLIDEFGKGTAPEDGIALLAATIDSLSKGNKPFTLVATHESDIWTKGILGERQEIRFRTMEYFERGEDDAAAGAAGSAPVGGDSGNVPLNSLVYLHRLIDGTCTKTFAYNCAQISGVPAPVIDRARAVRTKLASGEDIEPLSEGTVQLLNIIRAKRLVQRFATFDIGGGTNIVATLLGQ